MGYFEEARERAKRRKSPWNLLLIPAVFGTWVLMWYASVRAIGYIARRAQPESQFSLLPDSGAGILIAIGLLLAWLPIAAIIGNLIVTTIPPARRVLDGEAKTVRGTDFASANRSLLRVAAVLTPTGLAIAVIGILAA
jgi:hypothetical protein